jgi:hypothetical protein
MKFNVGELVTIKNSKDVSIGIVLECKQLWLEFSEASKDDYQYKVHWFSHFEEHCGKATWHHECILGHHQ